MASFSTRRASGAVPQARSGKLNAIFIRCFASAKSYSASIRFFLLITAHSPGITPMSLQSLMPMSDGTWQRGEMLLQSPHAALPAGVYLRWTP